MSEDAVVSHDDSLGNAHEQRNVAMGAEADARVDGCAHFGCLEQPRRVTEFPRDPERFSARSGTLFLAQLGDLVAHALLRALR